MVGARAMSSSITASPCYGIMNNSEARAATVCRQILLMFKVKVGEGEVCDAIDVLRVVCCRGGDSWVLVDRRGDRLI